MLALKIKTKDTRKPQKCFPKMLAFENETKNKNKDCFQKILNFGISNSNQNIFQEER